MPQKAKKSKTAHNNSIDIESTFWKKPGEAANILGVHTDTLRRWSLEGKINHIVLPSGHRVFDIHSLPNNSVVEKNEEPEKKRILYARVSSAKQKKAGDLARQISHLKDLYPGEESTIIEDVGSGINFKRRGLQRILELAFKGSITEIVCCHRDRLCRISFELLEYIFNWHGVKITVADGMETEKSDPQRELVEDLLAITTVFACKLNGKRRYQKKRETAEDSRETGKGEESDREKTFLSRSDSEESDESE